MTSRIRRFIADLLDRIREPGWPRRIAILVTVVLILLIPYPLSITGDFEVVSLRPLQVRNQIEGTLAEITVKMGDHVEKGQVVARLLDVELELERAKVKAELAEVVANLELTQKGFRSEEIEMARFRVQELEADVALKAANFRRETALYEASDIPKARLDQAIAEHVQAKKAMEQAAQELKKLTAGFRKEEIARAAAKVQQLEERLATTEQHLVWTQLRAPIAGQVVTPDHELQRLLGAHLVRGTPIMDIVAPEDLVARVEVPESEFGDVELAQHVELRAFQYPRSSFSGVVDMIEPQVERVNELSVVPIITRGASKQWSQLRVHTRGRAKISLGYACLGYVLYRRVLRSTFVKLWSWY